MLGQDRALGAHHGRALDDVAELPDIAGPGVPTKQVERRGRDRETRSSLQIPTHRRQERRRESFDLLRPVAQWRDEERDSVEPEVEILAQTPLLALRFDVSVGRR